MKPNPSMSLTSVMVPWPNSLKNSSTSCFRAVFDRESTKRFLCTNERARARRDDKGTRKTKYCKRDGEGEQLTVLGKVAQIQASARVFGSHDLRMAGLSSGDKMWDDSKIFFWGGGVCRVVVAGGGGLVGG